jgi:hypothetical protein
LKTWTLQDGNLDRLQAQLLGTGLVRGVPHAAPFRRLQAHFYDLDVSLKDFPFSIEDAKDLTRLLQRTVGFFCGHVFGPRPISMDGFVYAAAESLYETMRSASQEAVRKRAASTL